MVYITAEGMEWIQNQGSTQAIVVVMKYSSIVFESMGGESNAGILQ